MIQVYHKYIDHILCGFTITVVLIISLVILFPELSLFVNTFVNVSIKTISANFSKSTNSILVTLLIFVFIAILFLIGLFFEQLGRVTVVYELNSFYLNLKRSQNWLQPLIYKYNEYIGESYNNIIENYGPPIGYYRHYLSLLKFWHKENRQHFFEMHHKRRRGFEQDFEILHSTFLWHVLTKLNIQDTTIFQDKLRACKIMSTISLGLTCNVFLYLIILDILDYKVENLFFFYYFIASCLAPLVIAYGAIRSYKKYCIDLFSLLFLSKEL